MGDNNGGLSETEDAFLLTNETFWSDASMHFVLHGVNKECQIMGVLMWDVVFYKKNNSSFSLGDTGGEF